MAPELNKTAQRIAIRPNIQIADTRPRVGGDICIAMCRAFEAKWTHDRQPIGQTANHGTWYYQRPQILRVPSQCESAFKGRLLEQNSLEQQGPSSLHWIKGRLLTGTL